jgi:hypothetical protein
VVKSDAFQLGIIFSFVHPHLKGSANVASVAYALKQVLFFIFHRKQNAYICKLALEINILDFYQEENVEFEYK